jgi:hypothetical protein
MHINVTRYYILHLSLVILRPENRPFVQRLFNHPLHIGTRISVQRTCTRPGYSYLPGILFSSMSHSLGKCPPRGLRRARYILLPLAHDRGAPSSYANLSQISHGISLEIHNRHPLYPAATPVPPAAGGAGEKTHDTKEISKQSTLKINYFADGS